MHIKTSFGDFYLQFEHQEYHEESHYRMAYYKGELVEVLLPVGPKTEANTAYIFIDNGKPIDNRTPLSYGVAARNPSDAPNREMGRRLALERAIDKTGWGKSQRREFWNAYFGRSPRYANMVNNGKKRAA